MPDADEYEEDDKPPNPIQVAQRALIQSAVVCRGNIDHDPGHPVVQELHGRIQDWLGRLDLLLAMEPHEARILNAPLGSLDRAQIIRATWAAEGLSILAWALGRYDLPGHDEKVDPFTLTDALNFLDEGASSLLDGPVLRPREQLAACRELFYAIHCRYAKFRREKGGMDFTGWVEPEWLELLGVKGPDLMIGGDLSVGHKAILDADERRVREGENIICERHQASIWLVGEYPVYTETPADT
jgi:hypothetical protein